MYKYWYKKNVFLVSFPKFYEHPVGLGGFEITVEHESATGLTTEVESKWSKEGVKPEPAEASVTKYVASGVIKQIKFTNLS